MADLLLATGHLACTKSTLVGYLDRLERKPRRLPGATSWGVGRIAFRSHRIEITRLLADGWPCVRIFRHLSGRLAGLKYDSFRKYLKAAAPALETPTDG